MLEISLKLVELDNEDMFYFNNKKVIDDLVISYLKAYIYNSLRERGMCNEPV